MQEKQHPVRVVIVDDDQPVRLSLKLVFGSDPDIEVVGEAVNGRQAVELTAETRPDVVLMDCRMPVMDGLEATQIIKGRQPEVKVIMLTAAFENRDKAHAAGADAFLLKDAGSIHTLRDAILESSNHTQTLKQQSH